VLDRDTAVDCGSAIFFLPLGSWNNVEVDQGLLFLAYDVEGDQEIFIYFIS
jgi:hypothetical protein